MKDGVYHISTPALVEPPHNFKIIEIKIKSQLRSGYAERFQAVAAQYTARIGVDYFNETIL